MLDMPCQKKKNMLDMQAFFAAKLYGLEPILNCHKLLIMGLNEVLGSFLGLKSLKALCFLIFFFFSRDRGLL